ncbi:MAG: FlgD immunoglobulin-like domain containing protein, partial [Ignavibacteria bacterium]|nr:FlgD immunoglobulin-like domain containing protein [Ignavibacteria bacterium]
DGNIPTTFLLGQNYPNPFNPTTSIDFSLPRRSNVRLEVFSITGELVNILTNQEMEPGNYKVNWDGKTADGFTLVSGIYIYRLNVDNQSVGSKKMILMK